MDQKNHININVNINPPAGPVSDFGSSEASAPKAGVSPALKTAAPAPRTTAKRVILYIVLFIVAYFLARVLGILGLILIAVIIYLALKTPQWYFKKAGRNNKFPEILAWLNVVSWMLPPLGLYSGLATIAFSKNYPARKKKYLILGIIGLGCAILNSVWGALGI
jgi:uncharacterized membrane protein